MIAISRLTLTPPFSRRPDCVLTLSFPFLAETEAGPLLRFQDPQQLDLRTQDPHGIDLRTRVNEGGGKCADGSSAQLRSTCLLRVSIVNAAT